MVKNVCDLRSKTGRKMESKSTIMALALAQPKVTKYRIVLFVIHNWGCISSAESGYRHHILPTECHDKRLALASKRK